MEGLLPRPLILEEELPSQQKKEETQRQNYFLLCRLIHVTINLRSEIKGKVNVFSLRTCELLLLLSLYTEKPRETMGYESYRGP